MEKRRNGGVAGKFLHNHRNDVYDSGNQSEIAEKSNLSMSDII